MNGIGLWWQTWLCLKSLLTAYQSHSSFTPLPVTVLATNVVRLLLFPAYFNIWLLCWYSFKNKTGTWAVFHKTSPGSSLIVNISCMYFPPIIKRVYTVSYAHAMSDILPGCFGLGGCQPQFCTSLQAQFDVVWIAFRHTHTPSLAFIQGTNAEHPLCSEGGIWQGPNTPGKKYPSLSSPSCSSHFHHAHRKQSLFYPKHPL